MNKLGIDFSRELTTIFIPSFFETILSGLNALNALKPLRKLTLKPEKLSRIQLKTENTTMIKSRILNESLR